MMKFSEALRLGSMMCPKAIGIRLNGKGERCALGAAAFGAGIEVMEVEAYWPELQANRAIHPVMGFEMDRASIVATLNNGFLSYRHPVSECSIFEPWTREAIADWYEQFETETQAAPSPDELHALAWSLLPAIPATMFFPPDFFKVKTSTAVTYEPVVSLAAAG